MIAGRDFLPSELAHTFPFNFVCVLCVAMKDLRGPLSKVSSPLSNQLHEKWGCGSERNHSILSQIVDSVLVCRATGSIC